MSDPTYRIDVARTSLLPDPYPWKARVFRLSDDQLVAAGVGLTKAEALEMARELIQRMTYGEDTASSYYVDDDGLPVDHAENAVAAQRRHDEGHSVKA